jgi:hypothetical protein
MSKSPKNTWVIPVTWQSWGLVEVPKEKYPTIDEVIEAVDTLPLPDVSEYVEGTMEIDLAVLIDHNEDLYDV